MGYLDNSINNGAHHRVRIFSVALASVMVSMVIFLLGASIVRRFESDDAPIINMVELQRELVVIKPEARERTTPKPIASEKAMQEPIAAMPKQGSAQPSIIATSPQKMQTKAAPAQSGGKIVAPTQILPKIAGQSPNPIMNNPQIAKPLPQINVASKNTIRDQECDRIDANDRPQGCPPTNRARREALKAQEPKYRPERVQGFRQNEVNAKYFAGWRERCQTNGGAQATVCIPIGHTPARVKTVKELCLEQGLSHCNGVPMLRKENSPQN